MHRFMAAIRMDIELNIYFMIYFIFKTKQSLKARIGIQKFSQIVTYFKSISLFFRNTFKKIDQPMNHSKHLR